MLAWSEIQRHLVLFLILLSVIQRSLQQDDERPSCDSMGIRDDLEKEVLTLFEDVYPTLPVKASKEKGNIELRATIDDDNHMVAFCEVKRIDVHPDRFKDFLVNFTDEFKLVSPMVNHIVDLEYDKVNERQGTKTFLDFPFFLSPRIMMHWRYLDLDRNPDEHLVYFSERENDGIMKYMTEEESQKYVLARTEICAFWLKPIREAGKVVGSNIYYLFKGTGGGFIPTWMQNLRGPATAYDCIRGLISHLEKKDKEFKENGEEEKKEDEVEEEKVAVKN